MKTVHEVSLLSGVSRRTLQYYDEIGLLTPCSVTEAGYRQYDDQNLLRLWQILFYKELGFSLEDIKTALDGSKESENNLLRKQKQVLVEKQAQLEQMTKSIDSILDGHFEITMLKNFNNSKIEATKKMYAKIAEQRMQNGDVFYGIFHPLGQYKMQKGRKFSMSVIMSKFSDVQKTDWDSIRRRCEEIGAMFYEAMPDGPDSESAEAAVIAFEKFILPLMQCEANELPEIGKAYLNDKKIVNQKIPGLAEFINEAIIHHSSK
jgi:Predicted transcriptional regulators